MGTSREPFCDGLPPASKPPVHPATQPGLRNSTQHPASGKRVTFPPPQQPEMSGSDLGSPAQPTSAVVHIHIGSPTPSGKHVSFPPPQQPEMSGSNLGSPAQPTSAVIPKGCPKAESALRALSSEATLQTVPARIPSVPARTPSAPAPTTAVDLPPVDEQLLSYEYTLPALEGYNDPKAAADSDKATFKHTQALPEEHAAALIKQQGGHEPTDHLSPPHVALSGYVVKSTDDVKVLKQMYASRAEGITTTEAAERGLETYKQDYSRLQASSSATNKSLLEELTQAKSRATAAEARVTELEAQVLQLRETVFRQERIIKGASGPLTHQVQPPPTCSAVARNPDVFVNKSNVQTVNMLDGYAPEVRVVTLSSKSTKPSAQGGKKNDCCTLQ